jgi:hypothetical protein
MVSSKATRPLSLLAAVAALTLTHAARADDASHAAAGALAAPAAPSGRAELPTPRASHAPVSTAKAHEDLRISVSLAHGDVVRSAGVVYRSAKGELRIAPLLRGGVSQEYVAILPADDVAAPGIAYAIELERTDGKRFAAFATRADLHPVLVLEDHTDARERAVLKRLDGRRSVVTASGELVRFGTTTGARTIPCAAGQEGCPAGTMKLPVVDDQYWRVEAGYTYRPLRAVAEFSLRIGVVRGTSLVTQSALDASKYKVGLNYAAPSVRFRMADAWHLELEAVTSISEIGFSVGGGGALLIGDPYGTRLTLGAEAVGVSAATYFGSRFYTRVDIQVVDRLIVAPVVEVTDMPHAEAFGVRLYGDVLVTLPRGFSLGLRAGYQARKSTSGGVALGTQAGFAF